MLFSVDLIFLHFILFNRLFEIYYSWVMIMKHVKMMVLEHCPHCRKASEYIDELKQENMLYRNVEIEVIDEVKDEAKTRGYDYWYVPAFFVNNQKIHEGVPSKESIQAVLEEAIS